jgi:hypothetical protein
MTFVANHHTRTDTGLLRYGAGRSSTGVLFSSVDAERDYLYDDRQTSLRPYAGLLTHEAALDTRCTMIKAE